MNPQSPIYVESLHKSYGNGASAVAAIRGIDFEVQAGEVFGLLGPNGAGKTSTVEILEGIRPKTSGEVRVLGFDPDKQKTQLKDQIGVCLQATNLPEKITVKEALDLFASFYSKTMDSDTLIKRLQLTEKRDSGYGTLSGGQKQRLALALALINDPQMLFLDEPTAALDPQVRVEIRDLIDGLRKEQRTILMTTHYIEEAERLCDRVAIIDQGKIIALGTPRQLIERSAANSVIEIVCSTPIPADQPLWPDSLTATLSPDAHRLTVISTRPARTLVEIVKWIDSQGLELADINLKRPTLEDVFIELTGKKIRE
jgi:ABC-2 type transport system ATP-binding protein